MFESDKHYEDTFYQGRTHGLNSHDQMNTGTKNDPGVADHVPIPW